MARSISTIYNELSAEKDRMSALKSLQPNTDTAQNLLDDVSSPSKVADWRLWLWIVAFAIHVFEGLLDAFKTEVNEKVAGAKSHNLIWYRIQALAFQYGYDLVFDDVLQKFGYATSDASSLIITRAATSEGSGTVVMKVAKEAGALSAAEKTAFSAYMGQIKDAGTDILVISTTPDEFKITAKIYYDPLVINPDGSLILDSSVFPIEDQIEAYISALPFDGAFNRNSFIDSLQEAEGVDDPVITDLQVETNLDPYTSIPEEHNTYSGYYTWNAADSTIQYIAKL